MKTPLVFLLACFWIVGCNPPLQDATLEPLAKNGFDMPVKTGFEVSPLPKIPEDLQDIFDIPGFRPTIDELSKLSFDRPNGDGKESGLTILVDLLEHTYEQTGDMAGLEIAVDARLANVPEYPEQTLLLRAAHAAWVERTHAVPWSLKDFDEAAVRMLFFLPRKESMSLTDETWLNTLGSSVTLNKLSGHVFHDRHLEQEISFKMYPIASQLLRPTRDETIRTATAWVKSGFFHFYNHANGEYWSHELYRDGRTDDEKEGSLHFFPTSLHRLFEERAGSCQTSGLLLESILRSLNVPMLPISVIGHASVYVPEGDFFIHGDPLSTHQALAVDDFLFPSTWLNEATGDALMEQHLAQRVLERYGNDFLLYNVPQIKRSGETLYFSYVWDIADNILANWQQELPQYNIHFVEENGARHAASDPVPIRTLAALSAPGASVW